MKLLHNSCKMYIHDLPIDLNVTDCIVLTYQCIPFLVSMQVPEKMHVICLVQRKLLNYAPDSKF